MTILISLILAIALSCCYHIESFQSPSPHLNSAQFRISHPSIARSFPPHYSTNIDTNADANTDANTDIDIDIDTDTDIKTQLQTGDKSISLSSPSSVTTKPIPSTTSSQKYTVIAAALSSIAAVALSAKLHWIPGYTSNIQILKDAAVSILTALLAYAYVKIISTLALNRILQPRDSRKLIHTLSAPLFLLLWPLFSDAGRFFAATVSFANGVRLYLAGQGDSSETELVNAVSRSGDFQEAVGGPFIYILIVTAATLLFWKQNLVGVMAVSIMAAGDGMADLVGRRYGKNNKWFFSKSKSIAGSAAFVAAGALCAFGLAIWLSNTGSLTLPVQFGIWSLFLRIFGITTACAFVELLPIGDDNWTVPITAAILSAVLLQ